MSELILPKDPSGTFALDSASRKILDSGDEQAIFSAMLSLYEGFPVEGSLLRVEKQGFYVYYHGYTTGPDFVTDTTDMQYFYVNGRYVKEKTLYDSVRTAYKKLLPAGDHPACCLFLTIKPYRLDEFEQNGENAVRFYDPYNVGNFCRDAVIEALRGWERNLMV